MSTANQMGADFNLRKSGAGFANRSFNDREISKFLSQAQTELTLFKLDPYKNRTQRGFNESVRQNEIGSMLSSHVTFKVENHDFMMGTPENGAKRTPDLDAQLGTVERYGVFVNLPDEALMPIDGASYCTLSKNNTITEMVPAVEVSMADYNKFILDPYKNPDYDSVWVIPNGSFTPSTGTNNPSVKGITGVSAYDKTTPVVLDTLRSQQLIPGNGFTIRDYTLSYIKLPADIVVNVRNPALSVNCELPSFLHDEIVTRALRIAAQTEIPAEGEYQVMEKESRETE